MIDPADLYRILDNPEAERSELEQAKIDEHEAILALRSEMNATEYAWLYLISNIVTALIKEDKPERSDIKELRRILKVLDSSPVTDIVLGVEPPK